MLVNLPMIRRIARSGRPLIFSSGMSELSAVDAAIDAARNSGAKDIVVLQCTSLYPAPPETLNLRAIRSLRARYGVLSGLSDHSVGIEASVLAIAAGGCVIEKHFTFDRTRASFDHVVSLEPDDFAAMVKAIRRAETMLGTGVKEPTKAERERARQWTRRLVARRDIKARQRITEDDLAIKRTMESEVLSPLTFDEAVGLIAKHDLSRFSIISREDLEGDR
jgi:sialic acid synthase SpsE